MDVESRKLIEQMLAEEEYYYQQDSLPTTSKKRKEAIIDSDYSFLPNDSFKKTKKEGVISSASLPSHKTRWNSEEDDLLREALVKFGYGNWKAISEYIKTRNPLQCKNHARHLMQTDKVEAVTKLESEHDIPVAMSEEAPQTEMKQEIKQVKSDVKPVQVKKSEPVEIRISEHVEIKRSKQAEVKNSEHVEIKPMEPVNLQSKIQLQPHQNPLFERHQVSEEEMIHNPEWFKQKYSKTPDRYLKIRNHMLDCWHQCKPKYLTKTSARKGLKDCGDVNAIGRVHQYLESVGAINVDCTTHAPRPPKRIPREVYEQDDPEEFDASEFVVGYDGPRKRKVRNEKGDWVDPKELEGRVIEHDVKPKRVMKKSNQYYGGDDFGRGYDPFRLVPTNHYNDDLPAPFEVEILSDALLVMDFHSHLAHTEIIGLLGGNFITRGETKILQVKSVFPCQSTSTGIQCEMDPASEMKAREVFADKGFDVVGWYHSHPTFEPHPSIRDIENQTSYQTLFRKEDTGDEPFIGVIVTPYDPEILSDHSQIQYLHISKEWNELHSFRVPYACRRTVLQSEQVSSEIFNQLVDLIQEYKDYEHKVNMLLPFSTQTRLDKLLDSLKAHLFLRQQDEETFIQSVKDLVLANFVPKEPIQDCTQ
ncbi:hypothetical protein INT48_009422 [Thamnidium elegans]|uniref:Myb-like, SWIRM and MPN domain-containing protein 1 n=1 Tax=Thamnidium elegans TaxID=101142 RepID=A0A8H7VYT0_9FUNG|nr:hypothetical protein INT48_009422 [Thamnidium elegans]